MATIKAWLLFLGGLPFYALTGRTPIRSYYAMRYLHTHTDGRFNDRWRLIVRRVHPHHVRPVTGALGDWTSEQLTGLARDLDEHGYTVFDRRLPTALCDQLEQWARRTPALPLGSTDRVLYATDAAVALRYDFAADDIMRDPAASALARDETFKAIAGAYFGARPTFDFVAMWWTTCRGERDLSTAAQLFHSDMDRLVFLKFFVYLNDVTPENGPHVFVRGSHRRKPTRFRDDRRFDDDEVATGFEPDQIVEIGGPRGTVFAADTRGLHKGAPVRSGERLVLQVEYATDLFGQNYAAPR